MVSEQRPPHTTKVWQHELQDSRSAHARLNHNGVVFVFGGQGSQKPGMAAELFQSSSTFRESLIESDKSCAKFGYNDLLKYLVDGKQITEYQDTIGPQLALVAFELGLAAMWKGLSIVPKAVIGNSIGEYAALCVAGVLDEADALFLIHCRARLLEKRCQANAFKMLVVTGSDVVSQVSERIETLDSTCGIACFNSPRKVVVGGPKQDVDHLATTIQSEDMRITVLDVPYAFHTRQIEPISAEFRAKTDQVAFKTPNCPFGSTLLGSYIMPGSRFPSDYLARHACEPAQFMQTLKSGLNSGLISSRNTWLEIGPSATCLSFVKDTLYVEHDHLLYSFLPPSAAAHSQIGENASKMFGRAIALN